MRLDGKASRPHARRSARDPDDYASLEQVRTTGGELELDRPGLSVAPGSQPPECLPAIEGPRPKPGPRDVVGEQGSIGGVPLSAGGYVAAQQVAGLPTRAFVRGGGPGVSRDPRRDYHLKWWLNPKRTISMSGLVFTAVSKPPVGTESLQCASLSSKPMRCQSRNQLLL